MNKINILFLILFFIHCSVSWSDTTEPSSVKNYNINNDAVFDVIPFYDRENTPIQGYEGFSFSIYTQLMRDIFLTAYPCFNTNDLCYICGIPGGQNELSKFYNEKKQCVWGKGGINNPKLGGFPNCKFNFDTDKKNWQINSNYIYHEGCEDLSKSILELFFSTDKIFNKDNFTVLIDSDILFVGDSGTYASIEDIPHSIKLNPMYTGGRSDFIISEGGFTFLRNYVGYRFVVDGLTNILYSKGNLTCLSNKNQQGCLSYDSASNTFAQKTKDGFIRFNPITYSFLIFLSQLILYFALALLIFSLIIKVFNSAYSGSYLGGSESTVYFRFIVGIAILIPISNYGVSISQIFILFWVLISINLANFFTLNIVSILTGSLSYSAPHYNHFLQFYDINTNPAEIQIKYNSTYLSHFSSVQNKAIQLAKVITKMQTDTSSISEYKSDCKFIDNCDSEAESMMKWAMTSTESCFNYEERYSTASNTYVDHPVIPLDDENYTSINTESCVTNVPGIINEKTLLNYKDYIEKTFQDLNWLIYAYNKSYFSKKPCKILYDESIPHGKNAVSSDLKRYENSAYCQSDYRREPPGKILGQIAVSDTTYPINIKNYHPVYIPRWSEVWERLPKEARILLSNNITTTLASRNILPHSMNKDNYANFYLFKKTKLSESFLSLVDNLWAVASCQVDQAYNCVNLRSKMAGLSICPEPFINNYMDAFYNCVNATNSDYESSYNYCAIKHQSQDNAWLESENKILSTDFKKLKKQFFLKPLTGFITDFNINSNNSYYRSPTTNVGLGFPSKNCPLGYCCNWSCQKGGESKDPFCYSRETLASHGFIGFGFLNKIPTRYNGITEANYCGTLSFVDYPRKGEMIVRPDCTNNNFISAYEKIKGNEVSLVSITKKNYKTGKKVWLDPLGYGVDKESGLIKNSKSLIQYKVIPINTANNNPQASIRTKNITSITACNSYLMKKDSSSALYSQESTPPYIYGKSWVCADSRTGCGGTGANSNSIECQLNPASACTNPNVYVLVPWGVSDGDLIQSAQKEFRNVFYQINNNSVSLISGTQVMKKLATEGQIVWAWDINQRQHVKTLVSIPTNLSELNTKNLIVNNIDTYLNIDYPFRNVVIPSNASVGDLVPAFSLLKGKVISKIIYPKPTPDYYKQCPDSDGTYSLLGSEHGKENSDLINYAVLTSPNSIYTQFGPSNYDSETEQYTSFQRYALSQKSLNCLYQTSGSKNLLIKDNDLRKWSFQNKINSDYIGPNYLQCYQGSSYSLNADLTSCNKALAEVGKCNGLCRYNVNDSCYADSSGKTNDDFSYCGNYSDNCYGICSKKIEGMCVSDSEFEINSNFSSLLTQLQDSSGPYVKFDETFTSNVTISNNLFFPSSACYPGIKPCFVYYESDASNFMYYDSTGSIRNGDTENPKTFNQYYIYSSDSNNEWITRVGGTPMAPLAKKSKLFLQSPKLCYDSMNFEKIMNLYRSFTQLYKSMMLSLATSQSIIKFEKKGVAPCHGGEISEFYKKTYETCQLYDSEKSLCGDKAYKSCSDLVMNARNIEIQDKETDSNHGDIDSDKKQNIKKYCKGKSDDPPPPCIKRDHDVCFTGHSMLSKLMFKVSPSSSTFYCKSIDTDCIFLKKSNYSPTHSLITNSDNPIMKKLTKSDSGVSQYKGGRISINPWETDAKYLNLVELTINSSISGAIDNNDRAILVTNFNDTTALKSDPVYFKSCYWIETEPKKFTYNKLLPNCTLGKKPPMCCNESINSGVYPAPREYLKRTGNSDFPEGLFYKILDPDIKNNFKNMKLVRMLNVTDLDSVYNFWYYDTELTDSVQYIYSKLKNNDSEWQWRKSFSASNLYHYPFADTKLIQNINTQLLELALTYLPNPAPKKLIIPPKGVVPFRIYKKGPNGNKSYGWMSLGYDLMPIINLEGGLLKDLPFFSLIYQLTSGYEKYTINNFFSKVLNYNDIKSYYSSQYVHMWKKMGILMLELTEPLNIIGVGGFIAYAFLHQENDDDPIIPDMIASGVVLGMVASLLQYYERDNYFMNTFIPHATSNATTERVFNPFLTMSQWGQQLMKAWDDQNFKNVVLNMAVKTMACWGNNVLVSCNVTAQMDKSFKVFESMLTTPIYMIGLVMTYTYPLIPFLMWSTILINWLLTTIFFIFAGPFIFLGIVWLGKGNSKFWGKSSGAPLFLLSVLVKPSLYVLGFVMAYLLVMLSNVLFFMGIDSLFPFNSSMTIFERMAILSMTVMILIGIATRIFSYILQLPDNFIRYFGGTGVSGLDFSSESAAGSIKRNASKSTQAAKMSVGELKQIEGGLETVGNSVHKVYKSGSSLEKKIKSDINKAKNWNENRVIRSQNKEISQELASELMESFDPAIKRNFDELVEGLMSDISMPDVSNEDKKAKLINLIKYSEGESLEHLTSEDKKILESVQAHIEKLKVDNDNEDGYQSYSPFYERFGVETPEHLTEQYKNYQRAKLILTTKYSELTTMTDFTSSSKLEKKYDKLKKQQREIINKEREYLGKELTKPEKAREKHKKRREDFSRETKVMERKNIIDRHIKKPEKPITEKDGFFDKWNKAINTSLNNRLTGSLMYNAKLYIQLKKKDKANERKAFAMLKGEIQVRQAEGKDTSELEKKLEERKKIEVNPIKRFKKWILNTRNRFERAKEIIRLEKKNKRIQKSSKK